MPTQTATNEIQYTEKSRRHPRWTRQENLTLIQAKEITENNPHKGGKISCVLLRSSSLAEKTKPKWVMISMYCKQQGVDRGPAQCRKRWTNLIGDYKRVKVWESKLTDKSESYWTMRKDIRKENKLPISFDVEVFKVLEGRETGPIGAVSPMPLQAVLVVSEDEEEEVGDEAEDVVEGGDQVGVLVDDEVEEEEEDEVVWDLGNGEEARLVLDNDKKTVENIADSFIKKTCSAKTISEEHHHQAFLGQNSNSKQDTVRKSILGVYDSPEKVKKRRISTDERISNGLEGQILKALEANNKLLDAQLDSHNKNWELDKELKKENNESLMAALGKLTDVVMKIAEKL